MKDINTLIENLKDNIKIKNKIYHIKTKTWYSIEEDENAFYIKCELSDEKVLVVIPDDELIYIGSIIKNIKYNKIDENKIEYNNSIFKKTGEGHQFITKIEFGDENEVEGRCVFEDYEFENSIISLGVLEEKNNERADVLAEILNLEDIETA